ncbi:MAG: ribosome recycling factor [Bacteroidia bacterium]|nr:ribosome recycling factor [Bacteroidia bacterium]
MEKIRSIIEELKSGLEKNIRYTQSELNRIRAGKAQPEMLERVMVDYYGAQTPINQVANVSAPESRTLTIQPWDKSIIGEIERAIINSNLGLNPQNDGEMIRINIPPLTEQRRIELVKTAKQEAENSKIGIRNLRKEANESLKNAQKEGASEDEVKDAEAQVQKLVDHYIDKIDAVLADKEKEIKTI